MKARLYTDGGARGNPGPAAYAVVIERSGQPVYEEADCLGETTNNVAEYTALLKALERVEELGGRSLAARRHPPRQAHARVGEGMSTVIPALAPLPPSRVPDPPGRDAAALPFSDMGFGQVTQNGRAGTAAAPSARSS